MNELPALGIVMESPQVKVGALGLRRGLAMDSPAPSAAPADGERPNIIIVITQTGIIHSPVYYPRIIQNLQD